MSDILLREQIGPVLRLTLNRPERRNALSEELLDELVDALSEAAQSPETSVAIVRGSGSCFSAGADASGAASLGSQQQPTDIGSRLQADRAHLRRRGERLERLFNCPIPVIAQVHGHCLASAADLALHCDLVVVARDALIGHPGVRSLGVPPGAAMWLYRAGPQVTKRLLFTGDSISGEDAAAVGLALSAHDREELDDVVLALAQRISLVGRDLLQASKRIVNRGIDLMGRRVLQETAETEDAMVHIGPSVSAFASAVATLGLAGALRERDDKFGGRGAQPL